MKKILMLVPILFLASCCTNDVTAEKATMEVVEPAHRQYVLEDDSLTEAEKQRRLRLLDAWRMRIEAQKKPEAK